MQNPFQNEVGGQQEWFSGGGQPSYPSGGFQQNAFGQPGQNIPMTSMGSFDPQSNTGGDSELDLDNEPPILEELGIDIDAVMTRIKSVAFLRPLPHQMVVEGDLSGPLIILGSFMVALMLQGKVHMEYVYGLFVTGWIFSWGLINLMAQQGGIDMYCAASMFGYSLLPVVFLAILAVPLNLQAHGWIGAMLGLGTIVWCMLTSSKFVASAINTCDQQYLIAYPIGLLYSFFVVLTIF